MNHQNVEASRINELLKRSAIWKLSNHKLKAALKFADFSAAFKFMTAVALEAERLNHHPNWTNVYNRVEIELWTHETNGLSAHDLELAAAIERLYSVHNA